MPDLLNGAYAVVDEPFTYQKANKFLDCYAGAAFPANPVAGVRCWRTDLKAIYIYDGTQWITVAGAATVAVKTDNYSLTLSDWGSHIYMNNAASKTFSLPSVAAANVGCNFWLGSRGAGAVVIDAADSDVINTHWGSSAAGGNVTNAANTWWLSYIELVTETNWMFMTLGGDGFAIDP